LESKPRVAPRIDEERERELAGIVATEPNSKNAIAIHAAGGKVRKCLG